MSDVAFDGPEIERVLGRSSFREDIPDSRGLDWVTDFGSSSMSFDETDILGAYASTSIDFAH